MKHPILYSFRRCPYAMRARMALAHCGFSYELREIDLKNKHPLFLETSPKATVPVLLLEDGTIIDESMDIVSHMANKFDPNGIGNLSDKQKQETETLYKDLVENFVPVMHKYKYFTRFPDESKEDNRKKTVEFLKKMNALIGDNDFIFGNDIKTIDYILFPFIRQCLIIHNENFENENIPNLMRWYTYFSESALFKKVMAKYPVWEETQELVWVDNQDI